jgi:hypothetical protein
MKRLLLSLGSARWLESIGLWMIIGGLVAEAALFIDAIFWELIPSKPSKWLSFVFTLTIAIGVWLEHVGMAEAESVRRKPRRELLIGKIPLITEALRSFGNITFDVGMGPNDGEVENFIWDLEPGLLNAGWSEVNWTLLSGVSGGIPRGDSGRPLLGGVAVSNVSIQIHPGQEPTFGAAADALVAALNKAGFEAQRDGFNIHNGNANAMHILIGPKR